MDEDYISDMVRNLLDLGSLKTTAQLYELLGSDGPDDALFGGLPAPWPIEDIEHYINRIGAHVMANFRAIRDSGRPLGQCKHCGMWLTGATEDAMDEEWERHHADKHPECDEFKLASGQVIKVPGGRDKAYLN